MISNIDRKRLNVSQVPKRLPWVTGLRRFERCWKNIRETSRQETQWTWMSSMTLNEDLWTIGYLQSLDRLCGGHMGPSAEFQFVCFVADLLCMWSAIAPLLEDGCPNAQCEDRFRRTSMILLPSVVSILPLWIGASNSAWHSGQVFTDRIYHCILIVYASFASQLLSYLKRKYTGVSWSTLTVRISTFEALLPKLCCALFQHVSVSHLLNLV